MTAVFAKRSAHAAGFASRAALWLEAFADIITNAPIIHYDILRQDLRFAFRTIGRAPLFSTTVVVVAAIGVGATTAAFSLADHVLIRPLPFGAPERLVKSVAGPFLSRLPAARVVSGDVPRLQDTGNVVREFCGL
jgi:hypothetical protein